MEEMAQRVVVDVACWVEIVQRVEQLIAQWLGLEMPVSGRAIRKITKRWLKKNGFEWDKLVIEKGNTDTRDPLGNTRNRFICCQEKKIRLFVEDDPNKAEKLADLCDIVFIPEQPYNHMTDAENNIVRVRSWAEIERFLRRIS